MRKFLLGTVTGAGLVLAGLGINSQIFAKQDDTADYGDDDHFALSGSMPSAATNFKLAKDRPDLEWDFNKVTSADYEALTVDLLSPIMPLSRDDLASVCIAPFGSNPGKEKTYLVDINLQPAAKKRLGQALEKHDDTEVAIRLLGQAVNYFFVDGDKARRFAAGEATTDVPDTADIFFSFTTSGTYHTLFLISSLTGKADIASCNADFDIDSMPGYQTHKKNWQEMAARVARGESWISRVE